MSTRSSLSIAFICAMFCSTSGALQPSVRAGSISLNSGIKPASNSAIAVAPSTTTSTPRGSAVSKFSTAIVPITVSSNNSGNNNNNNNSVSTAALNELQQQIDELRNAQQGLEQNQITRNDVEDTVEEQVSGLQNALTDIRSANDTLAASLETITERFSDSINTDIDKRLRVRGLLDDNYEVSFVDKNEVTADAIADKIVRSSSATATLSDKIQPKESDIKDIIASDLEERNILNSEGELNVVKKGEEVAITEEAVTGALNDSETFKNMVSSAATEKGFLSTGSDTFRNLANKSEIETLSNTLKADENTEGSIAKKLKDANVITASNAEEKLPVFAKAADVTELASKVVTTDNIADKVGENLPDKVITTDNAEEKLPVFAKAADVTELAGKMVTSDNIADKVTENLPETVITLDNAEDKLTVFAKAADVTELAGKMVTADNASEKLTGFADKNTVNTLRQEFDVAKAGVNDNGSILNKIKTDSSVRELLQGTTYKPFYDSSTGELTWKIGDTNTDSGITAVRIKGEKGDQGIPGDKGDKGDAGSGFIFKGNIANSSELDSKPMVQAHAYYCTGDELLYICSCDNDGANCLWSGTTFRGQPGETAWFAYCNSNSQYNLNNIIKPLYGNDKTCDNFTLEEYNALMGGAGEYCLYIAQHATTLFASDNADTPLAKKLRKVFNDNDIIGRLRSNGVNAGINGSSSQDSKFVLQCRQRYNEIMNPDTVEYTYCRDNFAIVKALYSDTDNNCSNFTLERYTAIMGGAKAYCLSLAKNGATLDLTTGIGKKLVNTFSQSKMDSFKSAVSVQDRISMPGFQISKVSSSTGTFMEACEARYNEIMAGETAWHAYCTEIDDNNVSNLTKIITPLYSNVTNCDLFTSEQYNAIMGGAKAYCLSLAKNGATLDLTTGIGKKLADTFTLEKMDSFRGAASVQARISMPGFKTSKTGSSTGTFIEACEARYNEIMSGADGQNGQNGTNGTNGQDGRDATTIWCEAHLLTAEVPMALSSAKTLNAFDKINTSAKYKNRGSEFVTTTGFFTSLEACLAAVAEDPSLMSGESAQEQAFSETKPTISSFESGVNELMEHRNGFVASLKGQNGTNGVNGKTWRPTFTNGLISWAQSDDASTISNFDVAGTAVTAVKNDIDSSASSLTAAITAKANESATNKISTNAVTMNDLVNYINNGLFQVTTVNGTPTVTLNTGIATKSGLTAGEMASIQKLSGAGSSSNSSNNFAPVITCVDGACANEVSVEPTLP